MAMQNGVVNKRMIVAIVLFLVVGGVVMIWLRREVFREQPGMIISELDHAQKSHVYMTDLNLKETRLLNTDQGNTYLSIAYDNSCENLAATVSGEEGFLVEYNMSNNTESILVSNKEMEGFLEAESIKDDGRPAESVAYCPGGGISFYYCSHLWLYKDGTCEVIRSVPTDLRNGGSFYKWIDDTTMYISTRSGQLEVINISTGVNEVIYDTNTGYYFEFEVLTEGDFIFLDRKKGWYYYDISENSTRLLYETNVANTAHALSPDNTYIILGESRQGLTGVTEYRLILLDIQSGKASVVKNWTSRILYGIAW